MIVIPGMQKKTVGVFGLGVTGIAAAEALAASGAQVFTWDENAAAREKTQNTEFPAEHPKQWPWKELQSVVLSPGVPLTHPKPHAIVRKARNENIEVVGDIELFARALDGLPPGDRPKIVAITGSNGKSTTTALIGHILRECGINAHVGGNIGEPVLALSAPGRETVYVLELSSFQLDLAFSFRPDIAVLLNITHDHIDRHGDFENYVAAKKRVFQQQTKAETAIVGVDDASTQDICTALMAESRMRIVPVSAGGALGRGVFALDGRLFYNLDGKTALAGDISGVSTLRGAHNWQNAAAALAVCQMLGVSPAVAVRAMQRFDGLAHRMERVGAVGKVVVVNDSKATNAEAAAKALASFDDIFWIAGGKAKEGGVSNLKDALGHVRKAYLIGEAAALFEEQLGAAVNCVQAGDLKTAFARALDDAAASKAKTPVVLLSPACASYDQFSNFEERGAALRRLVKEASAAAGEAA
ncbi:MAG: UDP-N-acetylmuramoyl-L-alanine--D-glutamate ligase [Parvularculaceae bacterium]